MSTKINLLDLTKEKLASFFVELGEKPYRAQQCLRWIHQVGVRDFSEMTNLGKGLRQKLQEIATIDIPEIVVKEDSSDGTCKWLLRLTCGNVIEMVFIPERTRGTLCVSSQVGCALNCSFCSTAKQGFNRDLSLGEIIGQVWLAVRTLSKEQGHHDRHVTNVVMMGMGEPLLNFDNVIPAMDIMMDDFAYGLSKYRVTLSTSGVLPELRKLQAVSPVSLAVSLHAPNNTLRNQLVPLNKKYPLEELMTLCKNYFPSESKRKVTFEYVMLKDVNDQPEHAEQLIKLLNGVPAKVNLIPFNTFPNTEYECSSKETINAFREKLLSKKINTTTRKTRGEDINAACGQLAGKVKDRTTRSARWQKLHFVKTA